MQFSENDAAVLIVFGQSNAHAHATKLEENEKINTPLKNVFGLKAEKHQKYGLKSVFFERYTSHSMNIAETQDHTVSVANVTARLWQDMIDGGKSLPDLYILQMSIGSQGLSSKISDPRKNMWQFDRERVMISGTLKEVDISLYPFACEVLPLVKEAVIQKGKNPVVIGLHWNQWETDATLGIENMRDCKADYLKLFSSFKGLLNLNYTTFLYRPLSDCVPIWSPECVAYMNEIFNEIKAENDGFEILDLKKSDLYVKDTSDHGIFLRDNAHYTPEAHRWFAKEALRIRRII